MGNKCSSHDMTGDVDCLVCFEPIDMHWVACTQCNVKLHHTCTQNFLSAKGFRYCKCPHCKSVGTLYNDSLQVQSSRCSCK